LAGRWRETDQGWLRAQRRQAQTLVRKAASVVVQTAWDGNQLDP
jgi:hypothetical protein